jgi:hypothetical protein
MVIRLVIVHQHFFLELAAEEAAQGRGFVLADRPCETQAAFGKLDGRHC